MDEGAAMTLRAASCFSGIGAPEVAMPNWDWLWCAEIEKFPSAVMAARHPDSVNLGDVTADDFMQRASSFGQIDVLAGGPPCQAFSVAGLRKSMEDDRGNLSLRFVKIAHAIRPRNLLVENVPGWLNTPDNAFGCFLGAILGSDDALCSPADGKWPRAGMASGPLGRLCWATLDAQYFGLAQRRQRVFVVVDFGNGADPASVLFEPESLLRHSPPSRSARKDIAGTIASGASSGSGEELAATLSARHSYDRGDGSEPIVAIQCADIAPTLDSQFGDKLGQNNQHINGGGACSLPSVAMCLNAGAMQRLDPTFETLIPTNRCDFDGADLAHTLKGEGFDASEDGAGCGTPLVPMFGIDYENNASGDNEAMCPLLSGSRSGGGRPLPAIAIQAGALRENPNSGPDGIGVQSDIAYTVEARAEVQAVQQNWSVRRLTPVECARLQGFDDDYLDITFRGKPAADGNKYKALGNSWAVPNGRWIMERIERFMP
jgi:DNA (cytosine-5)-methyltransferase 1